MSPAPSAAEMEADPAVREAFAVAWIDSFSDDPKLRHEEGGFLYYNPGTGAITVRRAPPGKRDEINLSYPPILQGWFLVATYHTHPKPPDGVVTAEPSPQDRKCAAESGVPWFVVSHKGNSVAGPERRVGGLSGSPTYPSD